VVILQRKGEPLSESEIRQLEEQLGHRIPSEYRSFLREHDGGVPKVNTFPIPGTENASGVNEYLSAARILAAREQYGGRLAHGLVPVAVAEGGNLVCLDLSDGSVVFWDHEFEDSDPVQFLARSFDRFRQMLEPFDPGSVELKPGQVKSVWVDPDLLK